MFTISRWRLLQVLLFAFISHAHAQSAGGLEITYDDGAKQTVPLIQSSEKIRLIEFKKNAAPPTRPANETVFGGTSFVSGSLRGEVYFINQVNRIPDLDKLRPVGQPLYTTSLNISPRRFDAGFPGISDRTEWFAIKYTGSFIVSSEGMYNFRTISDDGVILKIDDHVVIDDGGTHAPQSASGQLRLSRGEHKIRVDYFQGPRYDLALQLFVTPPGQSERIFDTRDFSR